MRQGFKKTILGIFRLSRPPFLKLAIVNTNVTISQKNSTTLTSNVDAIFRLVDSDMYQCSSDLH